MGRAPSRPKLHNERNVFLVGTPGQGKSATGNSILGKPFFPSNDNFSSITPGTTCATEHVDGHRMVIVDTPGIMDVRYDKVKKVKKIIQSLDESFKNCQGGFHAVLMVIKYGNRFQGEEIQLIKILKTALGANIFKEHGIIIVTNGDGFDLDHKGKDLTFDKWCKDQQGPLRDLLTECQERVILFYNNNYWRNATSVGNLFSLLDKMKEQYTKEMYNEHVNEREKYLLEVDALKFREHVLDCMDRIYERLQELATMPPKSENPEHVQTLMRDAYNLECEIDEKDKGMNLFEKLKERVSKLQKHIQNHQDLITKSEGLQ